MNSHNTRTELFERDETSRDAANEEDVRVLNTSLVEAAELSISEDCDPGGDPYNSTGQHVIIKSKIDPQD